MTRSVTVWKLADATQPDFPDDFEILRKAVLQVTDLKTNRNKYYALELHSGKAGGRDRYRVFTHYGRTDDLDSNPDAGQKELRYFDSREEAEAAYLSIYGQKTSPAKGYREVSLASSKIGSPRARGQSSGTLDAHTLEKLAAADPAPARTVPKSSLPIAVQALVRYLYDEATTALTTTVSAKITARGIETPLGILTIGQIERGEAILAELYERLQGRAGKRREQELERLTGELYTVVPHHIGRSREAVASAVIRTLEVFQKEQETLQLMKDMLQVNGEAGSVLYDASVDAEYEALHCEITPLDRRSDTYARLAKFVTGSQVRTRTIRVHDIFAVRRPDEWERFTQDMPNQQQLFHGSRIANWVGILSRGVLLPRIVVSMGGTRTDAGWLGNGIYFADAACTSFFYTSPGRRQTRFIAIARVALGAVARFTKITYGLSAPPPGFDSCHGVRKAPGVASDFDDDEYVIYTTRQQRLEYLVEVSG